MQSFSGEDGGLLAGSAFDDQIIRRGFVKKVYGILTAQLFATMAVMGFFQVRLAILGSCSGGWWMMTLSDSRVEHILLQQSLDLLGGILFVLFVSYRAVLLPERSKKFPWKHGANLWYESPNLGDGDNVVVLFRFACSSSRSPRVSSSVLSEPPTKWKRFSWL